MLFMVNESKKGLVRKLKDSFKIGLGLVVGYAGLANADVLKIKPYCITSIGTVINDHKVGALESLDYQDGIFLAPELVIPRIDFYSYNPNIINPDDQKLSRDVRPLESMTTYTNELVGVGIPSSENVNLSFYINDGAFSGKNIISKLYDAEGDLLRTDDVKELAKIYPDFAYTTQVENGLSKKLDVEFYDSADLNFDGSVDLEDLAILSNNWLRTGITTYDPQNDIGSYADINRDGNVDALDLAEFSSQWLYQKPQY